MADITHAFWRAVTNADFFNVERDQASGPTSGGGQLYFSISFGGDLDHADSGSSSASTRRMRSAPTGRGR